ncbi:MAG: ankyrin repeat domain-containing protein [Deltaproteobacteria bacterium]|nr:ankyrin repeat domain-containing protein [Deltaproteobacteria bacterium]
MTRTSGLPRSPRLAPAAPSARPAEASARPRTESAQDRYEGGQAGGAPAAPAVSPVFDLVGQYDLAGLRARLKAHPEEVKVRNRLGDTPLHAVADKGAVLLAEVLDELGASPLAADAKGLLPGHRAAENHPRTAAFLFERALAAPGKEPVWRNAAVIDKLLTPVLAEGGADAQVDALAAKLSGVSARDLNAPREIVKNRTHLESVKGTILEQKSEGWWQDRFAPQRVRSLLRAVAAVERGEVKAPAGAKAKLLAEVAAQLDLLQTARRVLAMRTCKSADTRQAASNLEARRVTPRILAAAPGVESTFALGWTGHAIYGGFVKVPADAKAKHPQDTLLIRIDNRGGGSGIAHDKDDEGAVLPRALHVPVALLEAQPELLERFIADLFAVKSDPEGKADDFYAQVAAFKQKVKAAVADNDLVESEHGVPDLAALPAQIAGNCVVANTFPGLASRLGQATFDWFRDYELALSRTLVDQHASLNVIIDEECKERDQREIGKALDGDGPWADKLKAILDAAGGYDKRGLAAKVTAPQLLKVIEHKDVAALRLLLAHGAKATLQGEHDRTPLHAAARVGDVAAAQALLEHGAVVNAMDDNGDTPLHAAVAAGCHPLVALLLDKGADRDRANKAGLTPAGAIDAQVKQTMLIAQALKGGDVVPMAKKRTRAMLPTGS